MNMHKAVSFSLGRIVATPGALAALEKVGKAPIDYLQRHAKGDWGEPTSMMASRSAQVRTWNVRSIR